MLTRETFIGPWAGLPVAWQDDYSFDESTYRSDVARCCAAGVPGVYTGELPVNFMLRILMNLPKLPTRQ